MAKYLSAFFGPVILILAGLWIVVRIKFAVFSPTEFQITKAHNDMIAKCDVGNLVILGDSTANAALLPSGIGPDVRNFGFGGATPIETFFIAQSILRCPNAPKAVILAFTPFALAGRDVPQSEGEDGMFWTRAVEYHVVNHAGAMQVLRDSRKYERDFTGPESLFDFDYKIKAALYTAGFPPYFFPDLQTYAQDRLKRDSDSGAGIRAVVYLETILDAGHHFYGTDAQGGAAVDLDASLPAFSVSPLKNLYLRRTIEEFRAHGTTVYLMEPAQNSLSTSRNAPGLIGDFQNYLLSLTTIGPGVVVLDSGFPSWDQVMFGDYEHLNLRGAHIYSENVRRDLLTQGRGDLAYADKDLAVDNLLVANNVTPGAWQVTASPAKSTLEAAPDIALPALQYPVSTAPIRLSVSAQSAGQARIAWPASSFHGQADAVYVASVFIKNVNAEQASLQLPEAGGGVSTIAWHFNVQKITYAGAARPDNSGVDICPGGWVVLYVNSVTGNNPGISNGPEIALSGNGAFAAYFYNPSLEPGLWPKNFCTLQPGEGISIPLPNPAPSAAP
jgi:hypothetical protein